MIQSYFDPLPLAQGPVGQIHAYLPTSTEVMTVNVGKLVVRLLAADKAKSVFYLPERSHWQVDEKDPI